MKNLAAKFLLPLISIFLFFILFTGLTPLPYFSGNLAIAQTTDDIDDDLGDFEEFDDSESVDELGEFEDYSKPAGCGKESCNSLHQTNIARQNKALYWVFGILGFTLLAGVLVRFQSTRNLKGLFLITSIVILGFYKGACPCPISSFSNLIIWASGVHIPWQKLIWFLGLIPITYLVGKVWCGWICHLGALQEFLYLPGRLELFRGARAQKVMKIIRLLLLALLIVQLLVTKLYLFSKIDPFKVAFNLLSINMTGWILLGLLILSSIFIHRPFCRAVCPIGLILGWIGKIPGASIIGLKGECRGCKVCSNACKIDAIHRYPGYSVLDNKECTACGDCLDACKKEGLIFVRKSKNHADRVVCERDNGDEVSADSGILSKH
ncbi:MAG: 4Fe-4S binding protein [candidate division Zixibacteria bacterium]|nr:4Fe-4S binding protein [candidate division Zixibacteria bacterium]